MGLSLVTPLLSSVLPLVSSVPKLRAYIPSALIRPVPTLQKKSSYGTWVSSVPMLANSAHIFVLYS
jgi:hypothetical protein